MKPILIILLLVAIMLVATGCEDRVDVKIYKHRETGNFIYCRTGELTDEMHSYQGEGRVAASKAVEC